MPLSSASVLAAASPIVGTVDEIDEIGAFFRCTAADCRDYARSARSAGRRLEEGAGAAIDRLVAKVDERLRPGAEKLERSVVAAAKGVDGYAAEVSRIHREARNALRDIDESLGEIAGAASALEEIEARIRVHVLRSWDEAPPGTMPAPLLGPAAADLDAGQQAAARRIIEQQYADPWLRAAAQWKHALEGIAAKKERWAELLDERRTAEQRLLRSLNATELGGLIRAGRLSGGHTPSEIVSLSIAGEFRGREGAPGVRISHPLLVELLGVESGGRIWDDPPAPTRVAANWASLDPAERQRLIEATPWVIGNLPGIPFAARDSANRRMLDFYDAHPSVLGDRGRVALRELQLIRDQGGDPQVSVVALDLTGSVPKVAVGYGDLDLADHLTWQVPGMESDADKALRTWDRASRNLYEEQQDLLERRNRGGLAGLVAFLSYDTPDLVDSLNEKGVLSELPARAGADRLADELDGAWAARNRGLGDPSGLGASDPPTISVVAHSYGTTTAANALMLTRIDVDAFTMAGSAGIDTGRVAALDELRVATGGSGYTNIFASHASDDRLAPLGLRYSGRANPNPELSYRDAPDYAGALHFSSNGYVAPDGEVFERTDGHSVIGEGDGTGRRSPRNRLGFEASAGHGYWDPKTQSLRNLAATSLGMTDQVLGGLHVAKN
ncbi:alpha/beta hydrolase [Leucobacter soli]|uniref:alpha/beta hydrolase n=1 Tax=Leucobacter soli TaxID=2812850 RepID=UPI0036D2EB5E